MSRIQMDIDYTHQCRTRVNLDNLISKGVDKVGTLPVDYNKFDANDQILATLRYLGLKINLSLDTRNQRR